MRFESGASAWMIRFSAWKRDRRQSDIQVRNASTHAENILLAKPKSDIDIKSNRKRDMPGHNLWLRGIKG